MGSTKLNGRIICRPGKAGITRREFCRYMAITPLAASMVTMSEIEANPIMAGILRWIARPTLRLLGFGSRTRKAVQLSSGERFFIPSSIASAAINAGAVLWAASTLENEAVASITNSSDEFIRASVKMGIQDIDTETIELEHHIGIIEAFPKTNREFPFLFKDLPHSGNKRVVGWTDDERIRIDPSNQILVLRDGDIYLSKE